MELKENQAALILEASAEGEITVDVQAQDLQGFASALLPLTLNGFVLSDYLDSVF